jgi:rhamnogalacturonyl hydrolase YesR
MARWQAPGDGRWHTIINDSSTYFETSVTSMTLFALAWVALYIPPQLHAKVTLCSRGVLAGWLSKPTYDPVVRLAWQGLASQVLPDGTVRTISLSMWHSYFKHNHHALQVNGICRGTGIQTSVAAYQARGTPYNESVRTVLPSLCQS